MENLVYLLLLALWLAVAFANQDTSTFKKYPDSCTSAKPKKNGVVKIQVDGKIYSVYCDVKTAGSAWLVIQRREDVSVNFFRNFASYQQGFGDVNNDFFIGLNTLNVLTAAKPQELYIHLEDFEGRTRYAKYSEFAIGNGANLYGLNVLGTVTGTAGDGLTYHKGKKFSTFDRDNSNATFTDNAAFYTGAWWYGDDHRRLVSVFERGTYIENIYNNYLHDMLSHFFVVI